MRSENLHILKKLQGTKAYLDQFNLDVQHLKVHHQEAAQGEKGGGA